MKKTNNDDVLFKFKSDTLGIVYNVPIWNILHTEVPKVKLVYPFKANMSHLTMKTVYICFYDQSGWSVNPATKFL
jgi:hypothetical protein